MSAPNVIIQHVPASEGDEPFTRITITGGRTRVLAFLYDDGDLSILPYGRQNACTSLIAVDPSLWTLEAVRIASLYA